MREAAGDLRQALIDMRQALALIEAMQADGVLAPDDEQFVPMLRAEVARLAELANASGSPTSESSPQDSPR